MKFEFLYPNAKLYDEIGDCGMMYFATKGECEICKERTNWVEINFQCFICSEECLNRIDNEFKRAYDQPHCEHISTTEFLNQPYYCLCGYSGSQDFEVEYNKSFYDGLILTHMYNVVGDRYCRKCEGKISRLEIYCVKNQKEYYMKKFLKHLNLN